MKWLLCLTVVLLCPSFSAAAEIAEAWLPPAPVAAEVCRGHLEQVHAGTPAMSSVEAEILAFRDLAEQALALRSETIRIGRDLLARAERQEPLTGRDLSLISLGIEQHLQLRREILSLAEIHECWLDLSPAERAAYQLSPEVHLQGVMLSLAAALVLYDNYLLAVSMFEGDPKLRRLLNEGDPGYALQKAELAKVALNYNSLVNRSRVRRAMSFFEREMERRPDGFPDGSGADYLAALIAQSPSYAMVRERSPLYVLGRKIGFLGALTFDTIVDLEREGITLVSTLFGNTLGLVETRQGKLYHRQEVLADLQGRLRSGDILLEKTPFRLTDKLIPGYWGHAAVWVGGEEELRDLGVWDNPVVTSFHPEIRAGRLVVEALRSGVEMNTLEHFLNIDSIGILRRHGLTREERARIVVQTLRQVGKRYDFSFDVESRERVYCSKLIYLAYQGIDWPTGRSLGRTTFTPDQVALRALDGGGLALVDFYHDGRRVTEQPLLVMAEQMGAGASSGFLDLGR